MNNLDKAYQNLLKDILENGTEKEDRTGTGTISVFGRQIRHKMSEGFPLLTTKKMAWKSMVTELIWFLRGDTNIKYLVDNGCNIWNGDAYKNYLKNHPKGYYTDQHEVDGLIFTGPSVWKDEEPLSKEQFINKIKTDDGFAKTWGELGPIYGKQWRSWGTGWFEIDKDNRYVVKAIDQIANLLEDLKKNPDSRRLMVSAWNVGEIDQMTLPPCHYGFQVYTRKLSKEEKYRIWFSNNYETGMEYDSTHEPDYGNSYYASTPERAISLMWNQRSVDTFLGLPFNIASYGLLLHILAKVTGMWPDELIGNLGDVHLYSNHVDQAKEQISREPFLLPYININTEFWLTESGECGEGPLSVSGFISALANPHFSSCLIEEDIQLGKYVSHPPIKAPLSN
jgi:thymidylate synthase